MATLEELYRYYLNQPITYVPGSTIGGLSSLTEINRNDAGGDSMGASPVTSINTDPNVTNTTPGTGIMGTNINFSDIGKAIGFAMNPALGIANLAATQVFGKSPMDMAMEAMGIGGFRGPQAGDLGYTDYSDADIGPMGPQAGDLSYTDYSDADIGPMGPQAGDFDGTEGTFSTDTSNTGASSGGVDSAGDGGDGYATGGRVGYAEGSITQEGVIPGFTKLKNPDGAPGNYNEFMYEGPDGQIYGAGTYSSIAAGMYPNIYEPSTLKSYSNIPELTQLMSDVNQKAGTTVIRNLEEADAYLKANAQTAPTVAEQIISTNNLSPFSSAPLTTSMAEKLFPQGDFLNIKETATSPTEYNIEATKDLVENLPGGIVKDIVAPTAAFALSLPYDAIQAYQRMEPGSGIQGFGKAFQAERPLESAFERFTGAAGPLAENINTAISSLNPFQKQQYMNYAVQNPEQAIAAAQQNKDFLEATRKNIAPTVSSPFLNAPKTPIGLFPGGGGGQTTPLIDEGPKTPIGLFPNRGGGEIKPLMAAGGRVFYLQGGLASLLR
jgi:hypothetical protein